MRRNWPSAFRTVKSLSILAALCVAAVARLSARPAAAESVEYLGYAEDLGPGWRSTGVVKPGTAADDFPTGNVAYGTDGYYVYGVPYGGSVGETLSHLPSYVSSITVGPGVQTYSYNSTTYAPINDPTQPIAAQVPNMNTGVFYLDHVFPTHYFDFFDITLKKSGMFGLGIILDTSIYGWYWNPKFVELSGPGGVSATNPQVFYSDVTVASPNPDATPTPDYAFFRFSGNAGDTFTLSLQATLDGGVCTSGIFFQPAPSRPRSHFWPRDWRRCWATAGGGIGGQRAAW